MKYKEASMEMMSGTNTSFRTHGVIDIFEKLADRILL